MSRNVEVADLFAPLIARFQDELRAQARTIVVEIIRTEIERRTTVLTTVDQAFEAALAKTRSASTTARARVARTKVGRASGRADSLEDGDASAIPPPPMNVPALMTASQRTPRENAQNGVALAPSLEDEERSPADPQPTTVAAIDAIRAPREAPPVRVMPPDRLARARARRAAAEAATRGEDTASAIELPGAQEPARAFGTVKRFDAVRGFGFILAPDGGEDFFVHVKDVVGAAHWVLVEGASVSYVPRQGQRGRFAVDVRPAAVACE